ncbi:DUF1080 domain-containing protein [Neolewinella lacunae]|uniref:DUF1080 domain-containing protein n=1 Tax=Neolewinella lacunae TaxID=1517758 RepID=A0A923PJK7_9BACT|nr:DUF1080 domain-containing protein [Neolewinella lacunae]MBC6995318.1 DUF1080 domain-containing protein [Neolewinella lacunae]MDN3633030.1 DUF1080 domain-containing protein [Neolewinella lacunae]
MQYLASLAIALVLLTACGNADTPEAAPPTENWQDLFNGQDLTGWTIKMSGRELGENYLNTFAVEDGMLRIKYAEYDSFRNEYGHIYYEQPYSNYRLRFEYRFTGEQTPGGATWNVRNSGVMLHSQSAASNEFDQDFPVSIELQLLGGLSNGEARTTGNVCTPGTAVMMGDTINYQHCISSSSRTYDGDRWVKAEAIVNGGESMHFLIEGDTVLSFQQPLVASLDMTQEVEAFGLSASWVEKNGQKLPTGYIALQAESHPIDFRNIQLLELR